MGLKRGAYLLGNAIGVNLKLNKRVLIILGVFILIGMGIGLSVIINPKIKPEMISDNLLDTNLLRSIRPNIGFGAMIMGRVFFCVLFFGVIFLMSLNRFTMWGVAIMLAYRGFALVINLYWVLLKFGFTTGLVLFFIYLVLFLTLVAFYLVAAVFCLRVCAPVRAGGLRGGIRWGEFSHAALTFLCYILAFAIIEWGMYWAVLSKIVFVYPIH